MFHDLLFAKGCIQPYPLLGQSVKFVSVLCSCSESRAEIVFMFYSKMYLAKCTCPMDWISCMGKWLVNATLMPVW